MKKQNGWTLLECLLVITMTTLLLSLALMSLLSLEKIIVRIQKNSASQMQTTLLYRFLEKTISQAGFVGCYPYSSLLARYPGMLNNKIEVSPSTLQMTGVFTPSNPVISAQDFVWTVENNTELHPGDSVIISNCEHAFIATVVKNKINNQKQTLLLSASAPFIFSKGMVSRLDHIQMFVKNHVLNIQQNNGHAQEWISEVDDFSVKQLTSKKTSIQLAMTLNHQALRMLFQNEEN